MPRGRRIVVPGYPHHVTQRGNRRMNVFQDKSDREVFLRMLREASELYSLRHYSYTLMTNHVHLISIPEYVSSMSLTMHDLLGSYASYFNIKYGLIGRLWQGRFYSTVMDEEHFWIALRYVERNPVRAEMVSRAEEYVWSAAAAHCGFRSDPILAPLPRIPSYISSWSIWIEEVDVTEHLRIIRENTKTGRPCGGEPFIEELERILGVRLEHRQRRHPEKRECKVKGMLPFDN